MDSLSRELAGLNQEIRVLQTNNRALQDSLMTLSSTILGQERTVAVLDSQYRILEAQRQPLVGILTKAVLADVRFSRWAVLDALLGSDSPGELLSRRMGMERLREATQQRAEESAKSLRELRALEDETNLATARLNERRTELGALLEQIGLQERELTLARDIALLQQAELLKKQAAVEQTQALSSAQAKQVSASLDTLAHKILSDRNAHVPSTEFGALKGALPWPASGSVASRFGKKRHRRLETVTENPGIDLKVPQGSPVRSVSPGKVKTVTWLRGFGNVCIVQHEGDHHTVYARLSEVLVRPEDTIDQTTILGYPGFDPERDTYVVHFEVWSGKEKQDPLAWLAPRR